MSPHNKVIGIREDFNNCAHSSRNHKLKPQKRKATTTAKEPIITSFDTNCSLEEEKKDQSFCTNNSLLDIQPGKHPSCMLQSNLSRSLTPLQKIPYIHGGYAAAAPFFLQNKKWMDILQTVMPDAYQNIRKKISTGKKKNKALSSIKMMRWAENNPVVAAYGILMGEELRRKMIFLGSSTLLPSPKELALEWDVFLDPNIVHCVENLFKACDSNPFLEIEIERQISRLMNRMLLTHGSTTQLIGEALGRIKRFNFNRVEQNVGAFLPSWLHIFAQALELGSGKSVSKASTSSSIDETEKKRSLTETAFCSLFLCMGIDDPNSSRTCHTQPDMLSSIKRIKAILGHNLSVVLDLKSRHVPPRVWGRLVDNMRARGLVVEGIGSFDIVELRQISDCCSIPVKPYIFFHGAGDLQRACHSKEVQHGDTIFFNAGSLLWQKPTFVEATECCHAETSKEFSLINDQFILQPFAYPRVYTLSNSHSHLSSLHDYQRFYNLRLGLYVQEFSISPRVMEILTNFINKNSSLYNLGLAWGGMNGVMLNDLQGDGFWNQRYMSRNWDLGVGPTDKFIMYYPDDYQIVREAMLAGACANVVTINDELEEEVDGVIQSGTCLPHT